MSRDHAVVGAGITGILLANVLKNLSLPLTLFDTQESEVLLQKATKDGRLISLSAENARYLSTFLSLDASFPIMSVKFYVHGRCVYLHEQSDPISYMLPYKDLYAAAWRHFSAYGGKIHVSNEELHLQKNPPFSFPDSKESTIPKGFDYVFACDGRHSSIRKSLAINVYDSQTRQSAMVGRVSGKHVLPYTALECFLPQGVLTLLPEEQDTYAFIWHVKEAGKKALRALSHSDFTKLMEFYAPDLSLGELLTPIQTFEIAPSCAQSFHKENIYLCGDAAHSLHPLSGQSLNVFVEALRGLSLYLKTPQQYKEWSQAYHRVAMSLFRTTTFIDKHLNSDRLLSTKHAVFDFCEKTGMASFVADYILGGKKALDRTNAYAHLALAEL